VACSRTLSTLRSGSRQTPQLIRQSEFLKTSGAGVQEGKDNSEAADKKKPVVETGRTIWRFVMAP
jgi:hypothetical protein